MLQQYLSSESIISFFFTLLGLLITVMSYEIGFGTVEQPGSGFFPFLDGLLILTFAGISWIHSVRRQSLIRNKQNVFPRGGLKRFVGLVIAFCLWIIFLPWLGFIISTFLVSLTFQKIMGLKGWVYPLAVSFGITFLTYILFDVVFYIDLPRGLLE